MKILYVITGLGLGGAERVTINLADEMQKKGHEVKIAYLAGNIQVTPKSEKIELIYLGLESIYSFPMSCYKYCKLISHYQPDIIHAHMVHANIFTRLNRLWCKTLNTNKLISTAHNSDEGGKLRMMAYRLTHSLANVTTNVSQEASQAFINKKAVKNQEIITVYNGINTNIYAPAIIDKKFYKTEFDVNHETIFLSVGRLHEQKDYPNLIKAIYILEQQGFFNKFPAKFLIAGDGDLLDKLKGLISYYKLNHLLILLGVRTDISRLMNMADFFVLSSRYEGFGLVVAEAMACNTFVIATDCGGVSEVMGNTGILVPKQNTELLANAIKKALQLPEQIIDENNLRARQRIEKLFSLETSVKRWLELYESK